EDGIRGLIVTGVQTCALPILGCVALLAGWGLPTTATQPIVLLRPLLATPRSAIAAYCAEHALQPRQDATNADPAYTRNRVRQEEIGRASCRERDYIGMGVHAL